MKAEVELACPPALLSGDAADLRIVMVGVGDAITPEPHAQNARAELRLGHADLADGAGRFDAACRNAPPARRDRSMSRRWPRPASAASSPGSPCAGRTPRKVTNSPVAFVPPGESSKGFDPWRATVRILLAIDGSPSSIQARDLVASLSIPGGSSVTMLTAYDIPGSLVWRSAGFWRGTPCGGRGSRAQRGGRHAGPVGRSLQRARLVRRSTRRPRPRIGRDRRGSRRHGR